jgi:molybdopterin/thiamine biosynthesis adenylyltransferase
MNDFTLSDHTSNQLRRYARHIVLPEIGERGQQKLRVSSALVIGAGGLGSAVLAYLAAAGVCRIGIVEPDRVELSNLQRQILFETADIGRLKAEAAADRLEELNDDCRTEIFNERFTKEKSALLKNFDIVIDASDNFETRFALADACAGEKKPLISAAISGFSAQLSTFKPYLGKPHPCYRCLVPEIPERERNCAQEGIAGPLAGMLGSMQALEAIKELLGIGESLSGRLLVIDALASHYKTVALPRDPLCATCADL